MSENLLREYERYLLVCLMEEASELATAAAKILRFGINDEYSGNSNRNRLEEEAVDLVAILDMISRAGIISPFPKSIERKVFKTQKWWEYSLERIIWGTEKR